MDNERPALLAHPNPRTVSSPVPIRNPPPAPRGPLALARGGQPPTRIPPSLQAKMAAMANRANSHASPSPTLEATTAAFQRAALSEHHHPSLRSANTAPAQVPTKGMAGRRAKPGLKLSDIVGPSAMTPSGGGASGAGLGAGRPNMDDDEPIRRGPPQGVMTTPFSNFNKIVDPSGALKFGGKAVLHASGVDFSNGNSFAINMTQMQLLEELGRGNYGTVKRVLHKPTNVLMAMKEIRLELDDSKLNAILMELDILHRAVAPEIVEFYGAFFIESCVYYCMEFMDAGSLDKLQGAGVPEDVLARITSSMVRGLKFLKDELQIMHRDVKPTNVLVNKKGEIKLCDFGVSGQLEKSLAKTNIGCQSYMAPERIKGESQNNLGTYTVSSDVWSLGLSIIEIASGTYPYPPETYSNVFAQLTAIVHGPPPELPDGYSEVATDFVGGCLRKDPELRATYAELLEHPFLVDDKTRNVDMVGWVSRALAYREAQQAQSQSQQQQQRSNQANHSQQQHSPDNSMHAERTPDNDQQRQQGTPDGESMNAEGADEHPNPRTGHHPHEEQRTPDSDSMHAEARTPDTPDGDSMHAEGEQGDRS
ncbi:kinase-like protein [Rickenella mellea]|uniref:mitogen-activated protein kinase kinase n=1 Tax=Rickenella mellea TaxID=50990 RepID=A0A4Y7QGE3_9AGAM|nr:kinase-like protein [Rickenella mellea]